MRKNIYTILVFLILILINFLPVSSNPLNNYSKFENIMSHVTLGNSQKYSDDIDWWTKFSHDLKNSGISSSTITDDIQQKIRVNLANGLVRSSPAVDNGRLFVTSWDKKIYCFNASDGILLWTNETNDQIWSSPAISNDRVYFGSKDEYTYCFNALDGNLIWKYKTGEILYSSPAIYDNKVYIGSQTSKVYCLDAIGNGDGTTDLIWSYTQIGSIDSSPAVVDDKVYIGSDNCYMYCLNALDGDLIWKFKAGTNNDNCIKSAPAIAYGNVYFGSCNEHKFYCIDAEGNGDGTTTFIWEYETGDHIHSSPAIYDGNVYFGGLDKEIYCLNASDGSYSWSFLTNNRIWSSPAIADDKLFIGSDDSRLYCLNTIDGTEHWNYSTGNCIRSSPAVANGKVYVGNDNHKIIAFGWENNPPNKPYEPNPENGEKYVFTDANISWKCVDVNPLDSLKFDIYFGKTSSPPMIVSNFSEMSYFPGPLEYGTIYYWRIVAWDNHGASKEGPVWEFKTLPFISLEEAVDNFYLSFSTGGDAEWYGQPHFYYHGEDAARSRSISNSQSTWMNTTVSGPGVIKFFWSVSSQGKHDYLRFYIDDIEQCNISGTVTWAQVLYNISSGSHELKWVYLKDDKDFDGYDTGWVDYVRWIIENDPPDKPFIDGPGRWPAGEEVCFTFHSVDPNGDRVKYIIDWGDGVVDETDYYQSCTPMEVCYTWEIMDEYLLQARAIDSYGLMSNWTVFEIEIPRTRTSSYLSFEWLLERFPLLERLLTLIRLPFFLISTHLHQ